jgi:RNA polymerase sigma-B factor
LVGVAHCQSPLPGGDANVGCGDAVNMGVERSEGVHERSVLIAVVMLVLTVDPPPLHLELGGAAGVERLDVPSGDESVEPLHGTTGAGGIVARKRRPQLVCAQHQPGTEDRRRPRQPEGVTRERHSGAQELEPLAAVVRDPGVAFQAPDAAGVERPMGLDYCRQLTLHRCPPRTLLSGLAKRQRLAPRATRACLEDFAPERIRLPSCRHGLGLWRAGRQRAGRTRTAASGGRRTASRRSQRTRGHPLSARTPSGTPIASHTDDELLFAYHRTGDAQVREQLVERFMPFARKLARRYTYTDEPLDDLVQVACVGLLKAIDRFEPGRGSRFTSFAAPTILGELKRHIRDKGWSVHVPRDLQERALATSRAIDRLSNQLGRSPSFNEVADAAGLTVEQVLESLEVAHSYDAVSLDAPLSRDADEPATLVDRLGTEDHGYELTERRQLIADRWRSLSELERRIVALRCVYNLSQREIGREVGYSQMHVSRLLRRSLKRLISTSAPA